MPVGRTGRLIIEPLTIAHADALAGLLDPRVNAHFAPGDVPLTMEDLRNRFADMLTGQDDADGRFLNFAVRLAGDQACIGRLEALVQGGNVEVAFLFVPDAWGSGYASEAVDWLIGHLADAHGARQIWACVTPSNRRSLALCHRLGFETAPPEQWPGLASRDDGDIVLTRTPDLPDRAPGHRFPEAEPG